MSNIPDELLLFLARGVMLAIYFGLAVLAIKIAIRWAL